MIYFLEIINNFDKFLSSSFQNGFMAECIRNFFEYGEKNKNQSREIEFVMTKINEITDDPF